MKALFAEAWQAMGWFSQFLATIVNGRDTVVRFSEPASLREIVRNETQVGRAAHKAARIHHRCEGLHFQKFIHLTHFEELLIALFYVYLINRNKYSSPHALNTTD